MKLVSISQLDTSNPGTWPIYYKLICWIVMVVAGVFLYNQFARTPLLEEQSANDSSIAKLQQDYRTLYQFTLDLPQYQERNKALVQVLKGMLAYLPSQSEMPDLIDKVYEAAVESGINFDIFQPEKDIKKTYYDIKPIKLKMETGYTNFAKFAEKVSSLQRILNISDMNFQVVKGNNSKLVINSQLQTYIYNQDLDALLNEGGSNESK